MTKTTKWFLAASVAMAVIASAFFAVGGRTGLTLLWIQYAVREESASYRDVEWQRGPSSPMISDTTTSRSTAVWQAGG